jgi:glucose-6-phosphate isomerase
MRESNQALFNTDDVIVVDQAMIDYLKQRALDAPTRRFRLCLHQSPDELVQEMIVVHCRDNYSRPHHHPDTASSLTILEGDLTVLLFDERGEVTRTLELGARGSGKPFTLRLAANVWHMPVCRSPQLVFYETMTGPFRRDAINAWAPWSPAEDDEAGIAAYLAGLGIVES